MTNEAVSAKKARKDARSKVLEWWEANRDSMSRDDLYKLIDHQMQAQIEAEQLMALAMQKIGVSFWRL